MLTDEDLSCLMSLQEMFTRAGVKTKLMTANLLSSARVASPPCSLQGPLSAQCLLSRKMGKEEGPFMYSFQRASELLPSCFPFYCLLFIRGGVSCLSYFLSFSSFSSILFLFFSFSFGDSDRFETTFLLLLAPSSLPHLILCVPLGRIKKGF